MVYFHLFNHWGNRVNPSFRSESNLNRNIEHINVEMKNVVIKEYSSVVPKVATRGPPSPLFDMCLVPGPGLLRWKRGSQGKFVVNRGNLVVCQKRSGTAVIVVCFDQLLDSEGILLWSLLDWRCYHACVLGVPLEVLMLG